MTSYEGPATLIHGTTEVSVTVDLTKRQIGALWSWDGTAEADDDQAHALEALAWGVGGGNILVRLPDLGDGQAIITRTVAGSGQVELTGTGPSPW